MSNALVTADGWDQIIGEHLTGAVTQTGNNAPYDILGELVAKSPAFRKYAEQRIAATRPVISQTPMSAERDWQVDIGPIDGNAGDVVTLTSTPQVLFRGEKVMATDQSASPSAGPAGYNTRITQIFVGQKSQRPANAGATLTAFFANTALGNGIRWDSCERGLAISVTVSFINDSTTFNMTVFGKAVL
jgi:hypothetical protein